MRLFASQSLVTLVAAIGWGLGADARHGLSALAGGVAVMLPSLVFAAIVFSVSPNASPKRHLAAFYRGEAVKIALTVVILVLVLLWFHIAPLPLLMTYILTILLYWPALLFGARQRPR